jgi:O-antigen/teichoic acid export membrane protein
LFAEKRLAKGFLISIRTIIQDRLRSRLGRETLYSLVCGVVYAFSQWLLLKLLFIHLGTATAGWYAYAMAVITPIMAFGSFGLRAILATDAKGEYSFSTYFTFRVATTVATLGCALVVYFLVMSTAGLGMELFAAFACLGLYRSAEWLSDLAQGEYQRQGRMRVVLGTFLFKLCFGLGGFAVVVNVFHRVDLAFLAMAFVTMSVLLGYELRSSRLLAPLKFQFERRSLMRIGRLALPVGIILLLGSLQGSIPRYALGKYADLETLGVFSALVYLGVFGGFLATAISNAMAPILSEHWAARRLDSFRKLLLTVLLGDVLVAMLMLAAFLLFGGFLLRLLFNAEVAAYYAYLPFVAGISLMSFWDSHLGCALTVLRRFHATLVIQIARVLIVTPIAFLLIRRWGIAGALWGSMAFPLSSVAAFGWVVVRDFSRAKREVDFAGSTLPLAQPLNGSERRG